MMRLILTAAAALFVAAPAAAGSFTAQPVVPAKQGKIVARDIVWTCTDQECRGSTVESRPAVLCQALAKKAGRLASFTANGRAFAAAELDRCNAAAPADADTAVAQAR